MCLGCKRVRNFRLWARHKDNLCKIKFSIRYNVIAGCLHVAGWVWCLIWAIPHSVQDTSQNSPSMSIYTCNLDSDWFLTSRNKTFIRLEAFKNFLILRSGTRNIVQFLGRLNNQRFVIMAGGSCLYCCTLVDVITIASQHWKCPLQKML